MYEKMLRVALDAALEAGELLRREFHKFGGPRGYGEHADADEEAEWMIRKRLLEAFPEHSYRGEETGSVDGKNAFRWLVDPNDGTKSFLRGARGSAVSIALLSQRVPVLGVVYAFVAPDDRGDLIYWAEGLELARNGKTISPQWDASVSNEALVLVSSHRDQAIEAVLQCTVPYRYCGNPSIAYRLALAAAGDAAAAVSWHSPGDWDYAAGQALLRGAGGILINETGDEVTYAGDGSSKVKFCFGGAPAIVRDLQKRDWNRVRQALSGQGDPVPRSLFTLARPVPGKTIFDPDLLSRAQGCMLGQCAGDAVGSQVEFLSALEIKVRFPQGVTRLLDSKLWNTLAGQPTDDSEMALLLARAILNEGRYNPEKAAAAYRYWYAETSPFDVGSTTAQALRGVTEEDVKAGRAAEIMKRSANTESEANGSLMRISPLGIYGYRKNADYLWELASLESSLTHPNSVCRQACALLVIAIADAIQSGRPLQQIYERMLRVAAEKNTEPELLRVLKNAATQRPEYGRHEGWVLVAFQNAIYQLIHSNSLESALVDTVAQGGDTDTNAAIAGALLGAVYGRDAVPFQWRQMVLSCRPHPAAGAQQPRPLCLWPVDIYVLAERLLLLG